MAPTKAKARYAAITLNLLAMVMAHLPDEFAAPIVSHILPDGPRTKKSDTLSIARRAARNVVKEA